MIINCGKRRIVSDRFGFVIEIKSTIEKGAKKGTVVWRPDRPAYPSTLARAFEIIYERTLIDDNDEIDVTELCAALLRARQCVGEYAKEVRSDVETN